MKYLIDGREVEVVQKLKEGYLVALRWEDYGGNVYTELDALFVADHIYDKAPTVRVDEKIKRLTKEVSDLMREKSNLYDKIKSIKEQEKSRLERYKKYEQLKRLDNFIDGKITHYVSFGWKPRIVKFEDAVGEYDHTKLKLLTLFGDSGGNLEWNLNQHEDASGCSETVIPCTSYDEARAVLQDHIDMDSGEGRLTQEMIDVAKEYDLKVDAEAFSICKKRVKNELMRRRNELKDKVDEVNEEILKVGKETKV